MGLEDIEKKVADHYNVLNPSCSVFTRKTN